MTARVEPQRADRGPRPPGEQVERAVATVDLGAIERNCRHLRSLLADGAAMCAVVKADGYGHGAAESAEAALRGGATWLAVAAAEEALALRERGIGARLLVMGALTGADARVAARADADVVAWDERFARELAAVAGEAGRPIRVHVKLDTGMGRLGTKDVSEALAVCDLAAGDRRLELAGVMTHFATADETGDDHYPAQLAAFRNFAAAVKRAHPAVIAHAANSASTYRDPESHHDMVRCGIAVYGLDPFNEDAAARGLVPALELASYVADVKRFAPGESVGYGRRWRATEETRVAVLPIGYGDGVRRSVGNNADVLVRGHRHPLVGTVSMDNVTVDLGPGSDVKAGDRAVLIGAQGRERVSCEELARRIGTINYEIACGLAPRVRRSYRRP